MHPPHSCHFIYGPAPPSPSQLKPSTRRVSPPIQSAGRDRGREGARGELRRRERREERGERAQGVGETREALIWSNNFIRCTSFLALLIHSLTTARDHAVPAHTLATGIHPEGSTAGFGQSERVLEAALSTNCLH
eukprot:1143312-Rhodomonas_salina.1